MVCQTQILFCVKMHTDFIQLSAVSPARMADSVFHADPQALFSSWRLLFYLLRPGSRQQGAQGRSPV